MDLPVEVDELTAVLDGRWGGLLRELRAQMAGVEPHDGSGLSTEEYRRQILDELHLLAKTSYSRLGFDREYGGMSDPAGSVVAHGTLGFGDLSLMVKAGVQWGLFGGAVQLLGTRRHHERYLRDIMDVTLPGCFAMTETGHGSDVQHLRTTASYDTAAGEFVISTPDESARKDYIGNAARDGRMAVVFAQLIVDGTSRGVHALLVPIRDRDRHPMPGVTISDCGRKGGLNGVDNGRLTFRDVRVPREALLNRFGDVAEDGTYSSPIASDGHRFFTMIGTLIRGRISVAGTAGSATKRALAIAVRYGNTRRQFDRPDGSGEVVLLGYRAHQRKLLPALATTYALNFAQHELVAALADQASEEGPGHSERRQRELEARAAGIKAVTTWHATATIQTCREACGGAGYLTENLLTTLKADTDVFTTFEGDNTVLLQLVAKGLLTNYRSDFEDLGTLATVRFMAEQFAGSVIERTAARGVIERLLATGPGRDDETVALEPGLASADLRGPRAAHARGSRPPAAARRGSQRPVRNLQRRPGPSAAHGAGARRPDRAGGVRRGDRPLPRSGHPGAAGPGLRPVRAVCHRGGPGLVPGPRRADRDPGQGRDQRGQRPMRAVAPARADAGGRVRDSGPAPEGGHAGQWSCGLTRWWRVRSLRGVFLSREW